MKEEMPPTGYKVNNTAYKIKIVRSGDEFTTALVGSYEGKAKYEDDKLTVINLPVEKTVTPPGGGGDNPNPPSNQDKEEPKPTPNKNEEPNKPNKSEKPDKPADKGDKEKPAGGGDKDKPSKKEEPSPKEDAPSPKEDVPSVPIYPLNNTPDPNLPGSPREIDVVYRDGTPIGRFIKEDREDGKKVYVLKRNGTPLSTFKFTKVLELPKTGGVDNIYYYLLGAGLALASGMMMGVMSRRRFLVRKKNRYK